MRQARRHPPARAIGASVMTTVDSVERPVAARSGTKTWFHWHSVTAALFGVLVFAIVWSGTFAAVSNEIDWLVTPELRVTPQGEPAGLGEIGEIAAAAVPSAELVAVRAPLYARFAAVVEMLEPRSTTQLRVYVDPYRREVTAVATYFTSQRFLRSLHANLFEFLGWGRYAVSVLALPLLALVITSLLFWKRWWRHFATWKPARPPLGVWAAAHKLIGLWTLVFALLWAITGTWYLIQIVRFHYVDGMGSQTRPPVLAQAPARDADFLEIDQILARVREVRPDLRVSMIMPGGTTPAYVEGRSTDVLVRDRANHLRLHPVTGEILENQRGSDLNAYWYFDEMVEPFHYGDIMGLPSKLIWFAFGLALSGLALSGAYLMGGHAGRPAAAAAGMPARASPKPRGARRLLRVLGIVLCVLALAVVVYEARVSFEEWLPPGWRIDGRPIVQPAGVVAFCAAWTTVTIALLYGWMWRVR